MRTVFTIVILSFCARLVAQDTTVTWAHKADPSSFIVRYDRAYTPQEFFSILGVDSVTDIANPGKRYQKGCSSVIALPRKRLNWIASDSSNHWIISLSYGGIGTGTTFYFIDKEGGVLNTEQFHLHTREPEKLSLAEAMQEVKAKRYLYVPNGN